MTPQTNEPLEQRAESLSQFCPNPHLNFPPSIPTIPARVATPGLRPFLQALCVTARDEGFQLLKNIVTLSLLLMVRHFAERYAASSWAHFFPFSGFRMASQLHCSPPSVFNRRGSHRSNRELM